MKTLAELRQERVKMLDARKALHEKAVNEKRLFTEDEKKEWDKGTVDLAANKTEIERLVQAEDRQRDIDLATHAPGTLMPEVQDETVNFEIPAEFAPEPTREQRFKWGMWCLANIFNRPKAIQFCKDHKIELVMSEGTDTAGGVLVPEEYRNVLIRLVEERGVFRRNSFVWQMARDTALVPRRTGGVTAYAVGESAEITASDPAYMQIRLTPKKWGALTRLSSELNEDAVFNIGQLVAEEIAYAFADKEDLAGFNGDGTSTHHGIFGATVKIDDGNHAASIFTAATGNTTFGTLDLADFEGLVGTLPQYAERGARWYISKAGWANSMLRLQLASGGADVSDISAGGTRQFMGYPVEFAQVLNSTLTAQTDTIIILFGDLRMGSTMGVRREMDLAVDSSRYFELDQIAIRGTERFDINVHELGDGTDAGAICAMKTPSS